MEKTSISTLPIYDRWMFCMLTLHDKKIFCTLYTMISGKINVSRETIIFWVINGPKKFGKQDILKLLSNRTDALFS